jgi:type III restriction enzyme
MFQLEKLAQDGIVVCYARNDRFEFNIPYELYGNPHVYEPDFLVKLSNGLTLVVEIKGREHEADDAKHQAAKRWVSAVNNRGKLGRWDFLPCRDPQRLGAEIALKLEQTARQ